MQRSWQKKTAGAGAAIEPQSSIQKYPVDTEVSHLLVLVDEPNGSTRVTLSPTSKAAMTGSPSSSAAHSSVAQSISEAPKHDDQSTRVHWHSSHASLPSEPSHKDQVGSDFIWFSNEGSQPRGLCDIVHRMSFFPVAVLLCRVKYSVVNERLSLTVS